MLWGRMAAYPGDGYAACQHSAETWVQKQHRDLKRPLPRSWESSAVLLLDSGSPSSRILEGFINLFILNNDPWSMRLSIYWTECLAEKTASSFLRTIGLNVWTADDTQSNLPVPQCWGTQASQPAFLTGDHQSQHSGRVCLLPPYQGPRLLGHARTLCSAAASASECPPQMLHSSKMKCTSITEYIDYVR